MPLASSYALFSNIIPPRIHVCFRGKKNHAANKAHSGRLWKTSNILAQLVFQCLDDSRINNILYCVLFNLLINFTI